MRPRDTNSEARTAQIEALRRLGGARRIVHAFEMSEAARALSAAGILAREPSCSEEEARARVLRSVLGDELYRAAFERNRD